MITRLLDYELVIHQVKTIIDKMNFPEQMTG